MDSNQTLDQLNTGLRQAEADVNALVDALSPASFMGRRSQMTAGLTWGYYGGPWRGQAAAVAHGTHALSASLTYYQVVDRKTGSPSVATTTTNWDDVLNYGRAYKIVTGASTISSYEDHRTRKYGILAPPEPHVNVTAVGNVGTGEDDLMTTSIPAATLPSVVKGILVKAWGTYANNANAKTLKLYFGSLALLTRSLTTNQAGRWAIEAEVIATGTDAQDYVAKLMEAGTASAFDVQVGSHTQDDGAAITVKCTGEATSNDDIKQEGLIVSYFG